MFDADIFSAFSSISTQDVKDTKPAPDVLYYIMEQTNLTAQELLSLAILSTMPFVRKLPVLILHGQNGELSVKKNYPIRIVYTILRMFITSYGNINTS